MKKKVILLFGMVLPMILMTGCTSQSVAKNFGGSMEIQLEPGQKLEEITWKDDELWYLTRPMTKDDIAETHKFHEKSSFGVFEGTVTIIECKE